MAIKLIRTVYPFFEQLYRIRFYLLIGIVYRYDRMSVLRNKIIKIYQTYLHCYIKICVGFLKQCDFKYEFSAVSIILNNLKITKKKHYTHMIVNTRRQLSRHRTASLQMTIYYT